MADDKATSSSSRKTMAPAAVDPAGADDRPAAVDPAGADEPAVENVDDERTYLDDMPDDELDQLAADVQRARRRRAREPREPSFGLSEGERQELENTGRSVSPFTGERRGDWSHERRPRR